MTIGIDLAKDVFEVGMSIGGDVRQRRRFTRRQFSTFIDTLAPNAVVVMEACGSAHYWARRCQRQGACVRLLPPQYVRAYVRRNKTDRADVDALLEAHRCGGIHDVAVKTVEQQTIQALHRVRQQWQKTRTARLNLLRGLFREYGVVFPAGAATLVKRVAVHVADDDPALPAVIRETAQRLVQEVRAIEAQLAALDRQLTQIARTHAVAIRLLRIPGIGMITATALVGSVAHMHGFRRGRQFASWLGLTPRERSSGARRMLGGISKQGDRYLRTLLTHGARSVLRAALARRQRGHLRHHLEVWAIQVAERRGRNRATIAIANKLARITWAVWTRDTEFVERPIAA
jgi:transposase